MFAFLPIVFNVDSRKRHKIILLSILLRQFKKGRPAGVTLFFIVAMWWVFHSKHTRYRSSYNKRHFEKKHCMRRYTMFSVRRLLKNTTCIKSRKTESTIN